ncbi:hypothetical protein [Pelagibacterium sp.]|uniref:hypothetical protein n=1 Tax=Pelagibacterium sp. TaxID=1967288 RepID=UPI003A8F2F55
MIIVLYAALGLAAITIIGNLMLAKWNAQRIETRISTRGEAYLASLEREGLPEALAAMSEVERRDIVMSAGHEVRAESDRRFYLATIGGMAVFFVALGFGIEAGGVQAFLLALLVGAAAIYGVTVIMRRPSCPACSTRAGCRAAADQLTYFSPRTAPPT